MNKNYQVPSLQIVDTDAQNEVFFYSSAPSLTSSQLYQQGDPSSWF